MSNDMQNILDIIEKSTLSDSDNKQESPPPTIPLVGGFLAPDNVFLSTDYLKNKAKSLTKSTEKLPPNMDIRAVSEDDLFCILDDVEDFNRTIRESLLESPFFDDKSRFQGYFDRINIVVSRPENTVIRLAFPPLLKAKRSDAYNVYWQVKEALKYFFQSEAKPVLFGQKLLLIYKKYTINPTVDYTCDNDNWETKRVTNAIAETFGITDDAATFSFLYTAQKAKKNYVEVTLIEQKNMGLFLDYLNSEI